MLDKRALTERDICTKFITPAIKSAGWDEMTQIREEVSFTKGRIIVRGKMVSRGQAKRADYILYYKPNENGADCRFVILSVVRMAWLPKLRPVVARTSTSYWAWRGPADWLRLPWRHCGLESGGGFKRGSWFRGDLIRPAPNASDGLLNLLFEAGDEVVVGGDQRQLGLDFGDNGLLGFERWKGDFMCLNNGFAH